MKRWFFLAGLALAVVAPPSGAQPMPPAAGGELPPNHPPVRPGARPASIDQDSSEPSPDLPRGTVVVKLVDPSGKELPGRPVHLGIVRQTVAEGESRDTKEAITDAEGKARFDGLSFGSRYNYRASVRSDPAEYASEPFSLREDFGQNVVMHVYPVTSDIKKAMIGSRGFIVIEPKDDIFQIQMMFRIFNVGSITWVPNDVVIELPRNAKAFNAEEGMNDTRFVQDGDTSARLVGTFKPGQHDVNFRFQVPNEHEPSAEINIGSLLPHMAELQVMVEAAKGMSMDVAGMGPAQPDLADNGQRMLATGRQLKAGEPEMRDVSIRLSGIPVPGPGRWYAAVLALLLAGGGVYVTARSATEKGSGGPAPKDVTQAREVLLKELVALEAARKQEKIGPRTYDQARRALIGALARLESQKARA